MQIIPDAGQNFEYQLACEHTKAGSGDERTLALMHCYVYVLGSEDGDRHRTYVGWTTDLDQRLARHNAGTGAKSTRGRNWVLLYAERYETRNAAMSREWYLKRDRLFRKLLWPA